MTSGPVGRHLHEAEPQVGESPARRQPLLGDRFRGSAPGARRAGRMLPAAPASPEPLRAVQLVSAAAPAAGDSTGTRVGENPCLHLENSSRSAPAFFPTDLPTQVGRWGRRPGWPGGDGAGKPGGPCPPPHLEPPGPKGSIALCRTIESRVNHRWEFPPRRRRDRGGDWPGAAHRDGQ